MTCTKGVVVVVVVVVVLIFNFDNLKEGVGVEGLSNPQHF
jgi:hypothetical protein